MGFTSVCCGYCSFMWLLFCGFIYIYYLYFNIFILASCFVVYDWAVHSFKKTERKKPGYVQQQCP